MVTFGGDALLLSFSVPILIRVIRGAVLHTRPKCHGGQAKYIKENMKKTIKSQELKKPDKSLFRPLKTYQNLISL